MILARGPDSASADEPGLDVTAPLPRVVRRTPRPLHPCRPASAEARNRAVGPAFLDATSIKPPALTPDRAEPGFPSPCLPNDRILIFDLRCARNAFRAADPENRALGRFLAPETRFPSRGQPEVEPTGPA